MKTLRYLPLFLLFNVYLHCQNGPSKPSVALSWTQSTTPGVTINNVYRCTQSGTTACTPAPPSIFTSTAPITSYTDNSVNASTNYYYAVTATVGSTESAYSNVVEAAIPASPNAPVLNAPTTTAKLNTEETLQAKVEWRKP